MREKGSTRRPEAPGLSSLPPACHRVPGPIYSSLHVPVLSHLVTELSSDSSFALVLVTSQLSYLDQLFTSSDSSPARRGVGLGLGSEA